MVHGYHVVLPMYGFWLPNDPRGSWSKFVRCWELARFGSATHSTERRELSSLSADELAAREAARAALKYPPVTIDGTQAVAIAHGFAEQVRRSAYAIWAGSILPEHTHLVVARHEYRAEHIANLLKGAATRSILRAGIHPLSRYAARDQLPPKMWSRRCWAGFLESEEAIEGAIEYVQQNPVREGKRVQRWSFITPFTGLSRGGWLTYH